MSISGIGSGFPPISIYDLKQGSVAKAPSVEEQFLEIAKKSPLERLRDKILEDMKIDEAALASMEPEARQVVEDEITRRMKEALEKATEAGQVIDKTA